MNGVNTYGGGTLVSAGALRGNTASLQGDIVNDASVIFDCWETAPTPER